MPATLFLKYIQKQISLLVSPIAYAMLRIP